MRRKAWSPYKDSVINYVTNNPGCSKWDVASYCTKSNRRCPSKQYYIVNTALRNGWIVGEFNGRQYELFIPNHFTKKLVDLAKLVMRRSDARS